MSPHIPDCISAAKQGKFNTVIFPMKQTGYVRGTFSTILHRAVPSQTQAVNLAIFQVVRGVDFPIAKKLLLLAACKIY